MPPRIDTRILFPAPRGGYLDLERFRHREWAPALRGAGLDPRGPYTIRHSFATWAIESGVQLSYLATIMGTSVRELESTYFRGYGERTSNCSPRSTPTTRRLSDEQGERDHDEHGCKADKQHRPSDEDLRQSIERPRRGRLLGDRGTQFDDQAIDVFGLRAAGDR